MGGGIFMIKDDETLIEMTEREYDSEELLQELLAKYPNLLAGDQIDSEYPRRWLLVSREINVPDSEIEDRLKCVLVEVGTALVLGKPVYLVGENNNIGDIYHHPLFYNNI